MNNQEKKWQDSHRLPTGSNTLTPLHEFTVTEVKCEEEDQIVLFTREQAIQDWQYYAAKVAFKGPQLLNGLAPSYRHLVDMLHGIRRFQAGWVNQPHGFLPMADEMKNMWSESLKGMFFLDYPSLLRAPEPTAEQVLTFEKMRNMAKEFDIPIAKSNRPFDFITPNPPFDIFNEGSTAFLTIQRSKLRSEHVAHKDYYIDTEMPVGDKCIEAVLGKDEPKSELPPLSEHNFAHDPVLGMLSIVSESLFDDNTKKENKE